MLDGPGFRPMDRAEVDVLVGWAADEGWNPGLHDAEVFWHTDPEAFIAAEVDGQLVGGGAITSYGGEFGFMGLFIVRPDHRGLGLGKRLWHLRRDRLRARLRSGATIGMDGVFEMQVWYAKGGFAFSQREIRFEAEGQARCRDRGVVALADVPFAQVLDYDRTCFPADRERFLRAWVAQPDSLALAAVDGQRLRGFGVIRRCREGAKVGPLFADDAATAASLYDALAAFVPGETVSIDVPEGNAGAMALVARRGMREVFGCARMYLGAPPHLQDERIFGITTFELG